MSFCSQERWEGWEASSVHGRASTQRPMPSLKKYSKLEKSWLRQRGQWRKVSHFSLWEAPARSESVQAPGQLGKILFGSENHKTRRIPSYEGRFVMSTVFVFENATAGSRLSSFVQSADDKKVYPAQEHIWPWSVQFSEDSCPSAGDLLDYLQRAVRLVTRRRDILVSLLSKWCSEETAGFH